MPVDQDGKFVYPSANSWGDSKDDGEEDHVAKTREHHENIKRHLKDMDAHLNSASDSLDHVESRMSGLNGGIPTPQRRPKSAPGGS